MKSQIIGLLDLCNMQLFMDSCKFEEGRNLILNKSIWDQRGITL